MHRTAFVCLILMLWTLGAGCGTTGGPNWFHPGPAVWQQARAERFDPYPENEPGPQVTGARPRAYDRPLPEVDRARWPQPGAWYRAGWLPWNWSRG